MTAYQHISPARETTRKEAVKTLRILLDNHTPLKMAFLMVAKTLKAKHLPHSRDTIYRWCREFKISVK